MSQQPIELKGSSFTLSVVHIRNPQPELIHHALMTKIDAAPEFLKNAPVVVNIGQLAANDVNWPELHQAIIRTGLKVVGVSGCKDNKIKQQVQSTGLPVLNEGKAVNSPASATVPPPIAQSMSENYAATKVITSPVRSGQQLYARNADLVVIGHVSAGAELVADGNIHVYGMMRGRALAGASGNDKARILCTQLSAELLSIAGNYWLMDQIPAQYAGQSACLTLSDGVLSISTLG